MNSINVISKYLFIPLNHTKTKSLNFQRRKIFIKKFIWILDVLTIWYRFFVRRGQIWDVPKLKATVEECFLPAPHKLDEMTILTSLSSSISHLFISIGGRRRRKSMGRKENQMKDMFSALNFNYLADVCYNGERYLLFYMLKCSCRQIWPM